MQQMDSGLKVFTCINHDQHWPVGCASVVVARSEDEARQLLDQDLIGRGLKGSSEEPYTLVMLPMDKPKAVVLLDGNY